MVHKHAARGPTRAYRLNAEPACTLCLYRAFRRGVVRAGERQRAAPARRRRTHDNGAQRGRRAVFIRDRGLSKGKI